MRVDWCVSSWFRIKNTHSLSLPPLAMPARFAQAAASLRPRRVDTPRHLDLLSCATVYAAAASGRHRERYIVHNTKNGAV